MIMTVRRYRVRMLVEMMASLISLYLIVGLTCAAPSVWAGSSRLEASAEHKGNSEAGRTIYHDKGRCHRCHGYDGYRSLKGAIRSATSATNDDLTSTVSYR